jgi:hypothetical protein
MCLSVQVLVQICLELFSLTRGPPPVRLRGGTGRDGLQAGNDHVEQGKDDDRTTKGALVTATFRVLVNPANAVTTVMGAGHLHAGQHQESTMVRAGRTVCLRLLMIYISLEPESCPHDRLLNNLL